MNAEEVFELYERCAVLRNRLREEWDTNGRWAIIRQYYSMMNTHILSGERVSPYDIGLGDHMTPIEYALWCEIRYYGLPFYLQYPVGRRFVDFGDPVQKIAIEADGAQWHTPEKDEIKDAELKRNGWRVFRVTGRDCLYDKSALSEVLGYYGVREELSAEEEAIS